MRDHSQTQFFSSDPAALTVAHHCTALQAPEPVCETFATRCRYDIDGRSWPQITLRSIPSDDEARALAWLVRCSLLGHSATWEPLDEATLCTVGGFRVREETLHAAEGRLEALLIPSRGGSFTIVIDSEPHGGWADVRPALRHELSRHRRRFRLAHEVAHTFFYDRSGDRPTPTVDRTEGEERFCDHFAAALLVPPLASSALPPDARSLLWLQQQFDVSLELAARVFSEAWGDRVQITIWLDRGDTREPQWSSHRQPLVDSNQPASGGSTLKLPERAQTIAVVPDSSLLAELSEDCHELREGPVVTSSTDSGR